MQPQQPPARQQQAPNYGFILDPAKPPRQKLFNFGGGSKTLRIAVVAGGILLLFVLFVGLKNILAGSNNSIPALVHVAQQQQELVTLAQNGVENSQAVLTKNFSVTVQVSLKSEQQQLLTYLQNNHRKVKTKELNLLASKSITDELKAATSTNSFDETYISIMKTKLSSYQKSLDQAFAQVKGPKGQALLKDDYKAAQLLQQQLGS